MGLSFLEIIVFFIVLEVTFELRLKTVTSHCSWWWVKNKNNIKVYIWDENIYRDIHKIDNNNNFKKLKL